MRLQLSLLPLTPQPAVPANYQYYLSSAIYHLLALASPEYATFLHEAGYQSASSERRLKMFTFSRLDIPAVRFAEGKLIAGNRNPWRLQIASPMEDEFVQNFVLGLFQQQELEIRSQSTGTRFLIEQVEALAPPTFSATIRFKTLSPLVVSTMREHKGKLQPYYYRANDPELGEAVRLNLLSKYEIIHGHPPADDSLQFTIDADYLNRRGGPEKVSKLITIKEGTREETRIKGFECPFTFRGNPDLMAIAWECGVGDHNSMGCGMVEEAAIRQSKQDS
jgi:CRISPR-associated endoribonuclease Cas6